MTKQKDCESERAVSAAFEWAQACRAAAAAPRKPLRVLKLQGGGASGGWVLVGNPRRSARIAAGSQLSDAWECVDAVSQDE